MAQKKLMTELERKTTEQFRESWKVPVIVVLDDVRSMHNVGSVFRTADSFLIEKICLCGYTPVPPHRDIHKTALGATETVTWQHYTSVTICVEELRLKGYRICAVEQAHGSIMLNELDVREDEKIALVFGNEVQGVNATVLASCDEILEIPQLGSKHSLNISVSVGIILWHFAKNYL